MRYGSVCSGIEAATVAWHPLGWEPAFFSEIEAFPRAVLEHHYTTPVHGDFTTIGEDDYGAIELLVGGTPCQSFSVAGLRKGLDDDRGNLALEFLRLAQRKRPTWVVWENVPGVLSSNGGRDFGSILGGMGELGYGGAYRVLDAQYFGVAQRRRRVFVVGYFGDWRPAAAVLFERHSMQGHPAPRREKRETAPAISSRSTGGGGLGTDFDCDGGLQVTIAAHEVVGAMVHQDHGGIDTQSGLSGLSGYIQPVLMCMSSGQANAEITTEVSPTLNLNRDGAPICFNSTLSQESVESENISQTLKTPPNLMAIATPETTHSLTRRYDSSEDGCGRGTPIVPVAFGVGENPEIAHCLRSGASRADKHESTAYVASSAVRRLTPRECARLQGFPDDYLDITYRGKPAADGPKYKALGNSMAVPVMHWIGRRIQEQQCLNG